MASSRWGADSLCEELNDGSAMVNYRRRDFFGDQKSRREYDGATTGREQVESPMRSSVDGESLAGQFHGMTLDLDCADDGAADWLVVTTAVT